MNALLVALLCSASQPAPPPPDAPAPEPVPAPDAQPTPAEGPSEDPAPAAVEQAEQDAEKDSAAEQAAEETEKDEKKASDKAEEKADDKGQDRHCRRIKDRKEKRACKKRRRTRRRSFPHRGLILEAHGGGTGCVGQVCQRNDAAAGGNLGAMVAGNVFGFVELGADINWGSMSLRGAGNPLFMNGVDPTGFGTKSAGVDDDVDQITADFEALSVDGGRAHTVSTGGTVRIHFLPYGRWEAFVGSGIGFSSWRANYETPDGDVQVRIPGVFIPGIAGFGYYPLRFMVINLQFQYHFSSPIGLAMETGDYDVSVGRNDLESDTDATTVDWGADTPQYWNVLLGLKFRI